MSNGTRTEPASPRRSSGAARRGDLPRDWQRVEEHGPHDVLVLDGGGQAKGDGAADPARLLAAGGTVVIDGFTPATTWPPRLNGPPTRLDRTGPKTPNFETQSHASQQTSA